MMKNIPRMNTDKHVEIVSHPLDELCEFRAKLRQILLKNSHASTDKMYEEIIALCDEYEK
jgi:hypothetical protein